MYLFDDFVMFLSCFCVWVGDGCVMDGIMVVLLWFWKKQILHFGDGWELFLHDFVKLDFGDLSLMFKLFSICFSLAHAGSFCTCTKKNLVFFLSTFWWWLGVVFYKILWSMIFRINYNILFIYLFLFCTSACLLGLRYSTPSLSKRYGLQ